MVRHIVLWTFKENAGGATKQENISKAIEKLLKLKELIKEVKYLECGKNFTITPDSFDLGLLCEFESKTDLEKYEIHPAHLELVGWLRTVRDKRAVTDFEF
jgi:hypothetical protein